MRAYQWYLKAVTLVLTGHGYCTWSKRLQRQAEGSYPLPAQVPVRTALASGTHSDSDQLTDLGILLFRMATTVPPRLQAAIDYYVRPCLLEETCFPTIERYM